VLRPVGDQPCRWVKEAVAPALAISECWRPCQ